MKYNIRSIMMLSALITLLAFLIGFRLGGRVEKINQTFVPPTTTPIVTPSIAPTSTPQPTPTPIPFWKLLQNNTDKPGDFKKYNKICGIVITYPSYLQIERQSSTEVLLQNKNNSNEFMFASCTKAKMTTENAGYESSRYLTPSTPTISVVPTPQSVTIQGQKVLLYKLKPGIVTWGMKHPATGAGITFEASMNFFEFLKSTLEFSSL